MKLKKYMLISMVAVTLASCGDDFLEEKMVATITQDYFETETGVEQLIVSTYDALRVTKQYQQGPFAFFTGVDNMMAKSANYAIYSGSVWTSTGNEATYVDGLCGEYTSNQLLGFLSIVLINCNRAILSIVRGKLMVNLLLIKLMQNNEWLKQCLIVPIVFI